MPRARLSTAPGGFCTLLFLPKLPDQVRVCMNQAYEGRIQAISRVYLAEFTRLRLTPNVCFTSEEVHAYAPIVKKNCKIVPHRRCFRHCLIWHTSSDLCLCHIDALGEEKKVLAVYGFATLQHAEFDRKKNGRTFLPSTRRGHDRVTCGDRKWKVGTSSKLEILEL